jgi:hypothetical protein
MTDPEKLRALMGYVQHKSDCGRTIARIRFGDADRGDCTCGLSTLLAEAEPSERRYTQAELTEAILLAVERTKQNIAEGRFAEVEAERPTPPVEDAVTRAKLETLAVDADWLTSLAERAPTEVEAASLQAVAANMRAVLRAHLKGSPE